MSIELLHTHQPFVHPKLKIGSKSGGVIFEKFKLRRKTDDIQDLRKSIIKKINKTKRIFKNKDIPNIKILTQVYFENVGWKNGKSMNINNLNLNSVTPDGSEYDAFDPGKVTNINVIYYSVNTTGGANKFNDCFYLALNEGLNYTLKIKPFQFKRKLGLNRKDNIPYTMIAFIEDYIKININLYGDYIYITPNKYTRTINLKLHNGHYFLYKELCKKYIILQEPKKNLIVGYHDRTLNTYSIYSNEKISTMEAQEYYNMKNACYTNFTTIDYVFINKDPKKTIEQTYNDFIKNANIVKDITNNFIDIFKFVCIKHCVLWLIDYYNTLIHPETIDQQEANWISQALMGGINHCNKSENTNAYQYDHNSFYPSLMIADKTFPIKKGQFVSLKLEDIRKKGYYNYGIYHAKITSSVGNNIFFKYNSYNKYTHFDMQMAEDLHLNIILEDGINALIYPTNEHKCKGKSIFSTLINYLYDLKIKSNKNPLINKIMQMIWGTLSERSKYHENSFNNNIIDLRGEDKEILSLEEVNVDDLKVKYVKSNEVFKTNYARIAPFITSMGRKCIYETLKNIKTENIIQIQTDGFIILEKLTLKNTTNNIGDLRLIKEGICSINNIRDIKWL